MVVAHETMHALANHAETLLDDFLEGAADAHDFAHRLHAGTDLAAYACKLGKVPTGYLGNDVIQLGCHVGTVRCAHLANLVEGVAQGYLGGNESQGITSGL